MAWRQRRRIEVFQTTLDRAACEPRDVRNCREAAPLRGAHLACGEQPSPPFIRLRAVRIPPWPNRLRVDHAKAGSGPRYARESVNPESLRRRTATGNAIQLSLRASLGRVGAKTDQSEQGLVRRVTPRITEIL